MPIESGVDTGAFWTSPPADAAASWSDRGGGGGATGETQEEEAGTALRRVQSQRRLQGRHPKRKRAPSQNQRLEQARATPAIVDACAWTADRL